MEAHDPGGGGPALPVLAVSTDLASPHHGGGTVEGETVAGRGDAGGQVDRGRPDVDRPGRGQPRRRVEHRLGYAILAAGTELLIDSAGRLDGVTTVGVDEHVWRHTRNGDKYVTVIIDLTPTRTNTGPSRLLAVVEGRSKQAFKAWLEAQSGTFRDRVEIVAMDGFTGYKTAAVEAIDTVTTVMDPFHVVALVGDKLDRCRQRVQQETLGHRGRSGDPLYGIRRVARTRAGLLTEKQQHRLAKVFTDERHVAFEVTWSLYQDAIDAYQADQPAEGKKIMTRLIASLQSRVPSGLEELRSLGQTMKRRRDDILAFFDHPRTSNGPTEAVNGALRT